MQFFKPMKQKDLIAETQVVAQEVLKAPLRIRTYRVLRKILIGFILISIANVVFSYFFYTPKMYRIDSENRELEMKYRILQERIRTAQGKLGEIKHRDNCVYRPLFSTDTLAIEGIYTPYPDSKYAGLTDDPYAPLMIDTWKQLDALTRQLYLQSRSLDELQLLSRDKEQLSAAIPAVWPIDRTRLRGGIGAFGMRRHPIYQRYIMHKGVDLACDVGVPVYATGDATVEKVDLGERRRGYGHQILLNHEFGYKTRYAHLSRMFVKPGDKVVRGQIIAEVGNTGGTTGPHLHYEVIRMGHVVNPVNYFNRNMSAEEYQKLMEEMRETNLETFDDHE